MSDFWALIHQGLTATEAYEMLGGDSADKNVQTEYTHYTQVTLAPSEILYLHNPSDELWCYALRLQTGLLPAIINRPNNEKLIDAFADVCYEAATRFRPDLPHLGLMIKMLRNVTEKQLLRIIPYIIQYDCTLYQHFSTHGCSYESVEKVMIANYKGIRYIEKPSPKIQMLSVQQNPASFFHIDNPCQEVIDYIVHNHPEIIRNGHEIAETETEVMEITLVNASTSSTRRSKYNGL